MQEVRLLWMFGESIQPFLFVNVKDFIRIHATLFKLLYISFQITFSLKLE